MVIIAARTNMGIEFINVCGSGIFGILLSFCFLKILGFSLLMYNFVRII